MRRHVMRRADRSIGSDAFRRREGESTKLARLTREIVEASGAHAAALIRLIERRAPNVTASDSAAFILAAWNAGGAERERIIAHAAKDDATIAAERDLALEIRRLMKPFEGRGFSVASAREIRLELVRFLRARLPHANVSKLRKAADLAVELRPDSLVLRTDGLVALLRSAPVH